VIVHCRANDLPCEKIEHNGKIEPAFRGWDISYAGEPDRIGASGDKSLGEPVRGNGPIVMAVRGAYPESPWHDCFDTMMVHEPFNTATAHRVP
jgi:hypothetical protein